MRNNGKAIVMNSEKKLVPSLRFPAFQQDGEWKEQEFGSLFNPLPNNTLSRADLKEGKGEVYNVHYGDVLIKLNSYTDIQQGKLPAIKTVNDIDKYLKSRLQDGDIVIADTAEDETVGKCTEIVNVHETIVVSGLHTIPCRPQIKFAQAYLGYYMNSNAFHNKLLPIMQGVKVTSISKSALQNIDLEFPESLEEQQKIAECLSSIDSYISSINEKVEHLKAHKTSLLQKLFPQNGKKVPEYRFSEFEKDRAWEMMKFGDVTIVVNRRNKSNRSLPIYSISNKDGFVLQSEQFNGLDSESRGYDISLYKIVGRNTFAYNPARINIGSIGYSGDLKEVLISSLYVCFKTTDELDDEFLICFLKTAQFNQAVENNVEGGIRSYLFYENFSRIKICLPSLLEQKKIASTILSIDEVISKYTDKVSLLEEYKKGLMQQLFPTITK